MEEKQSAKPTAGRRRGRGAERAVRESKRGTETSVYHFLSALACLAAFEVSLA